MIKKQFVTFLLLFPVTFCSFTATAQNKKQADNNNTTVEKKKLLDLEYSWLKAELSLDTAYVSSLMDESFMSITADGVTNKEEELAFYFKNISDRMREGVFVDSFRLEDPIVNFYGNTAVVTFVVHSFRTEKSVPAERKTRFYDVWIKQNGKWKAVSSQGTRVGE
jgi:hypothetical protein